MDKRMQIAVVVLIAVAIGAALLSRPPGPARDAGASPEPPADVVAGAPEADPGATAATPGDAPATGAAAGDSEATGQLPRFVEVGADSCVPCKMMQPILAEMRTQYAGKLEIDFADVWKNPALGDKYAVRTIPTQVIYDAGGREVFRHIGYWPKEEIDAKLKELGLLG